MKVLHTLNLLFMKEYNSKILLIIFFSISFSACNEHDNITNTSQDLFDKEREKCSLQKQRLEIEKRKLDILEKRQEKCEEKNNASKKKVLLEKQKEKSNLENHKLENEKKKLNIIEKKEEAHKENERKKLDIIEKKEEAHKENEKRKLDILEEKQKKSEENNRAKLDFQIKKHDDDLEIKRLQLESKEKNKGRTKNNKTVGIIEKPEKEIDIEKNREAAIGINSSINNEKLYDNAAPPLIEYQNISVVEDSISREKNSSELNNSELENIEEVESNEIIDNKENIDSKEADEDCIEVQNFLCSLGDKNTSGIIKNLKVITNKLSPDFFKRENDCIEFLKSLFNRLRKSSTKDYPDAVFKLIEKTSLYNKKVLSKFYKDCVAKSIITTYNGYREYIKKIKELCRI